MRRTLILIILILAGYLGNYFKFELFFGVDFIFGSIATLIVIYHYGLFWGTLAATVAGGHTIFLWGHPYAMLILIGEALFISLSLRRVSPNLVLLSGIYWFGLGMPLVSFFYHFFLGVPNQQLLLIIFKQAVNGIFNAIIANLIITYIPIYQKTKKPAKLPQLSFQQTIFNLLVAFIFIPSLILTTFNGDQLIKTIKIEIKTGLEMLAFPLTNYFELWYEQRLKALTIIGENRDQISVDELQQDLSVVQQIFPSLLRIYVTDANWNIIASQPLLNDQGNSIIGINIRESKTVQQFQHNFESILTEHHNVETLKDNKFPKHLHLNLPIIKNNQLQGLVSAAINLEKIQEVLKQNIEKNLAIKVTILSNKNQIIASSDLDKKVLTPFHPPPGFSIHPVEPGIVQWLPPPGKPTMLRWRNSFYIKQIPIGDQSSWSLVLQMPIKSYIDYLEVLYIRNLFLMVIISLLALVVSVPISRRLVKPLQKLAQVTTDLPEKLIQHSAPIDLPRTHIIELHSLVVNFQSMVSVLYEQFQAIQDANDTLEERVKERTEELLKVNQSLGTEIIQRQRVEMLLREREERYELAISGTQDGIWDWNIETNEIYYSPTFMRIIGYEDDPLPHLFSSWSNHVHPDDLETAMTALQNHLWGMTELYENTHRLQHRQGHYIWVSSKGRCISDVDGNPLKVVGTITDITEKKTSRRTIKIC